MVDLLNSMQGCNIVPILLYLDIQAILNRLAKKSFSNDASFRTAVHQEIASQEIGREVLILFSVHLQPSELQQRLIDSLPQEMDSKVQVLVSIHLQDVSRTFTFILHMEEQYIQMILNVRGRQREVHIGKLLRVLANCDNYKGIPVIVDIIFSYNSSVVSDLLYNEQIIARIINYLFKLPRNGYRETVELLNYHKNSEIGQLKAFFEHYYHNQWIDHVHFDDETVLSVVLRPKSSDIEYVTGNEYNRKGRLLYTGCYLGCQYNGHGKLYLDDQSYYEGTFENGIPCVRIILCVIRGMANVWSILTIVKWSARLQHTQTINVVVLLERWMELEDYDSKVVITIIYVKVRDLNFWGPIFVKKENT